MGSGSIEPMALPARGGLKVKGGPDWLPGAASWCYLVLREPPLRAPWPLAFLAGWPEQELPLPLISMCITFRWMATVSPRQCGWQFVC